MNQTAQAAPQAPDALERAFTPDTSTLAALTRSEIDTQIATARRFARSVTKFQGEAIALVSLNAEVADECVYALPRWDADSGQNKNIEGPSARFAEIIAYAWGNCRAGARVIDDTGEFVTSQGVFWDLEKNTAIGYEVKRRIVDKHGRRYKPDMIAVTANAGSSIALRNAILKGVPKALWVNVYDKALEVIRGDFQTLGNRREVLLGNLQKFGVTPEQVFAKLGVVGAADITLEHIPTLRGYVNALKEEGVNPEDMFPKATGPGERSAAAAIASAGAAPGAAAGGGVAADPATGQAAGGAAQRKPRGTPKQRKGIIDNINKSTALDTLAAFYDEANLFDWSEKEADELKAAYMMKKQALENA